MPIELYELVGADASRPFSPHCWKARLALRHKGLDFATVPVAFTQVPEIEGGATKIVPLLRDGDRLVADSFAIAEHLEATRPDAPTLFAGEGGRRLSRFVESWTFRTVHPAIVGLAILDIHAMLAPQDQAYFRQNREARYGKSLEAVAQEGRDGLPALRASLEPVRALLTGQAFLGGEAPLFADHILFGAFQWMRVVSPVALLAGDDPVHAWFERCLDLYGGEGRSVPAAAG